MVTDFPGPGMPGRPGALDGVKHSLAIASGKGGVGKSTLSVNLAVALAQTGASTGLLDADIYGPSIPIMMGINRMPQSNGQKMLPLQAHGVRLMSLGFLMPDGAPVIWRGPMVSGAIQQFLQDVEWGPLDYLLIDLPPGTGDAQLTLAQSLPLTGAVIVMTPQDLAMHIASKALAMFRQLKVPILGIIENMSAFVCPHCGTPSAIFKQGGGRRASERLGIPFLGEIPLDPTVCQSSDRGEPLVTRDPDSPVADAIRRVLGALMERVKEEALSAPIIRMGS
jgi:ATP-binding protein involved in chromosome partitioning